MKKIENTFAVTGYVANDAQVNNFDTASVARFSIAVNRPEKKGEEKLPTLQLSWLSRLGARMRRPQHSTSSTRVHF